MDYSDSMKTRFLIAGFVLAFSFFTVTSTRAEDEVAVVTDALVARPACLVATVVGSVIFVVALPVAATSGSIDSTADVLVKRPAWATFKRPLGDFTFANEYSSTGPALRQHRAVVRSPKAASEAGAFKG